MNYRDAFSKLLQAGYSPSWATKGEKIIGIEVYSSALSMDTRESLIKELLPDFRVYGIKHLERIFVENT